jgi:hypothetical protein
VRTLIPSEADLFYLPFYAISTPTDFEYKNRKELMSNLVKGLSQGREERYSEWEIVTGTSSEWWKRNGGKDHLIVTNIGGWRWGDHAFLKDAHLFHVTLELPKYLRQDNITSRVVIVPYPCENPPFVPLRELQGKF